MNRGFTLVELVICVAIFVIMTALLVAKYGTFNQSTLLTDTAYDIALVLHTAQSYGLSVKNANIDCGTATNGFNCAYGVSFNVPNVAPGYCGQMASDSTHLVLFADTDPPPPAMPDHVCTQADTSISLYTLTRGASISSICTGTTSSTCVSTPWVDITFLRPNPDATICSGSGIPYHQAESDTQTNTCLATYAQVTLKGSDNSTRTIGIYQNGQIVVNQ